MPLVLDGTNGVSGVDGTASNPAIEGTDSNTGIFYPAADTVAIGTGGTEALRVNSSQNVGIGTGSTINVSGMEISRATGVSPTPVELRLTTTTNDSGWSTTNPWGRLSFYSADASVGGAKVHASIQTTAQSSSGGNSNLDFFVTDTANGTLFRTLSFQGAGTNTTQTLFYSGGGINTMTLAASGYLGIGTSSPGATVHSVGEIYGTNDISWGGTGPGASSLGFLSFTGGNSAIGSRGATALTLYTNSAERARIDSSGRFMVGMTNFTATAANGIGFGVDPIGYLQIIRNQDPPAFFGRTVSTGNVVSFAYGSTNTNAGVVGSVSVTASTTAYNTSSDYRLKENIQPITGALAKVAALKPCTYTWKVDGELGEGFIAHELAEVCPQAVNGEKDAVDEDGNIKPQGIDTSFLVATLTAAIQELNAKVEAQAAEIAALKGNA